MLRTNIEALRVVPSASGHRKEECSLCSCFSLHYPATLLHDRPWDGYLASPSPFECDLRHMESLDSSDQRIFQNLQDSWGTDSFLVEKLEKSLGMVVASEMTVVAKVCREVRCVCRRLWSKDSDLRFKSTEKD